MWLKSIFKRKTQNDPNVVIHKTAVFVGGYIGRKLHLDKYSYICRNAKIFCDCAIGKYCSISENVVIGPGQHPTNYLSTHPFQFVDAYFVENASKRFPLELYKPVTIGNDVWIGINVIIQNGVVIGDGAIIGSGAVVTKNVPPYAIMGGVPARLIKYRFDEHIARALVELKWWELDENIIKNLPFNNIDACIAQLKSYKHASPTA